MNAPDKAVTQAATLSARLMEAAAAIHPKVVAWRRDLHANPELGNREVRTSQVVAAHLKSLGLDQVISNVAITGVVGVLKGGKPGPCVALRADMDGLPVTEQVNVPFASKVRTTWNGQDTGVMHACGHDTHVAMLMGAAEVLAGMRAELCGTVKFIFQPAEEGLPEGEEGGAKLMIDEGVLNDPKPDAIFGIHVVSALNSGQIGYRPGAMMASTDNFRIKIKGKQGHASLPWHSVDPVVASAHVVLGLQNIVSRQTDIMENAAVLTIGTIHGGLRENIIPDEVEMTGTLRTFDETHRDEISKEIVRKAELIACACQATADAVVRRGYPVTVNDVKLTLWSLPTLTRAAGEGNVLHIPKVGGGEDFSYFQQKLPGAFYFIGCTPPDKKASEAPTNHSPHFYVDEDGMKLGTKVLVSLVADFQEGPV